MIPFLVWPKSKWNFNYNLPWLYPFISSYKATVNRSLLCWICLVVRTHQKVYHYMHEKLCHFLKQIVAKWLSTSVNVSHSTLTWLGFFPNLFIFCSSSRPTDRPKMLNLLLLPNMHLFKWSHQNVWLELMKSIRWRCLSHQEWVPWGVMEWKVLCYVMISRNNNNHFPSRPSLQRKAQNW